MPSEKRPSKSRNTRTNQAPDERSARTPKAAGRKTAPKTDRTDRGEWTDKPNKPMKRGEQSFSNKPRTAAGKPATKYGAGKPAAKKSFDKTEGSSPYTERPNRDSGAPKRLPGGYGKEFRGATNKPTGRFSKTDKPTERKPYGKREEGNEERPYSDRPRAPRGDKPYAPRDTNGAGERVRRNSAAGAKRGPKAREERPSNELSAGAKAFVKFIKEKPPKVEKNYDEIVSKQGGERKGKGPKTPPPPDKPVKEGDGMRLNKYLAHSGVAARRKADEHIAAGHVKVNGVVVREMGHKIMPGDKVTYMSNEVKPARNLVYVLLNKPKDFVTTTDDEKGRRTVMELVSKATEERIYPVGRLDRATTGLLLFTNDGELAQKLTHPSFGVRKVYAVTLDKPLHPQDLTAIKKGLTLEDGLVQVDDVAYGNEADKKEIGIEIHVGKNRIVRRIFEHLGYEVVKLDRVMYAGLTKKDLPRGRWRHLDEREIIMLKHFKG